MFIDFALTKGDFNVRVSAAIKTVPEPQLLLVLFLTLGLVIARFALNSIIYISREFIDNKTQGWLVKKGYKSFTDDKTHQKLVAQVTTLHKALLASQNREKIAKEAEDKSTQKREKIHTQLIEYRTGFKNQSDDITKYNSRMNDLIDEIETRKNGQEELISQLNMAIENEKNKTVQLEKAQDALTLIGDKLKLVRERIKHWMSYGQHTQALRFIEVNDEDLSEADKRELDILLFSGIIRHEEATISDNTLGFF